MSKHAKKVVVKKPLPSRAPINYARPSKVQLHEMLAEAWRNTSKLPKRKMNSPMKQQVKDHCH